MREHTFTTTLKKRKKAIINWPPNWGNEKNSFGFSKLAELETEKVEHPQTE